MRMIRSVLVVPLWVGVSLAATVASACGSCATGAVDRFLSPIGFWWLLASLWLPLLSIVASPEERTTLGLPRPALSVCLAGACFLAGGCLGPVLSLFLILLPVRAVVLATKNSSARRLGRGSRFLLALGSACLLALVGSSLMTSRTRTNLEYGLQWSGTGLGRQALRDFVRQRPPDLVELRKFPETLDSVSLQSIGWAAVLMEYGDPEIDVPILILALEKSESQLWSATEIGSALKQLSGLDPEDGWTSADWGCAWRLRSEPEVELLLEH